MTKSNSLLPTGLPKTKPYDYKYYPDIPWTQLGLIPQPIPYKACSKWPVTLSVMNFFPDVQSGLPEHSLFPLISSCPITGHETEISTSPSSVSLEKARRAELQPSLSSGNQMTFLINLILEITTIFSLSPARTLITLFIYLFVYLVCMHVCMYL